MLLMALAGCALQEYTPKPLHPERSAAVYATRSTDDRGLKRYMLAHGVSEAAWPVRQWGLQELTLLAFYFHPDLALARTRMGAARASMQAAQARRLFGLVPRAEHHSEERPGDTGPWSLGFELELPIMGASRRSAIVEAERLALESAQLQVAGTAWQIRSRVRAALLAFYSAQRGLDLTEKEMAHIEALVKLLQRRLQEGMTSVGEVTTARLRATQVRADAEAHKLAAERALGDLCAALGVPLEVVRFLPLSFAEFKSLAAVPDTRAARAQALSNRIDIRTQLLAYAGAESVVKLEVARQYPELRLSPGYLWDRGESVWSLGLGVVIPAAFGNAPGIRLALAQREVAARQFEQLQMRVLSESASKAAIYRQSLEGLAAIEAQTTLVQQRLSETEKLFTGGYADRVALVQSKLESVGATKAAWSARRAALDAMGELEDATQIPLKGGPLPKLIREEYME